MQQKFSSFEESKPLVQTSANNPMIHSRIDAYLIRTCATLFVSLPQEEALEQRAEMQSHLESLVAAHTELGFSETEAVTLALEQFGKEQNVAQAWKQECEVTNAEAGRGTFLSAIRPVAGYCVLAGFAFPMVLSAYACIHGYAPFRSMNASQLGDTGMALLMGEALSLPACLGFVLGRRARGKVLSASLIAFPFLCSATGHLTMQIYHSLGMFQLPFGADYQRPIGDALFYFSLSYSIKLGVAVLGAGAARWQRKKTLQIANSR